MQTDAAVDPGDDQHRGHLPCPVRRRDKEYVELLRIELLMVEQGLAETRTDDVSDDERGNA